jgi:adenosylcobinamide-GDP ribazoletransferase
MNGSSEFLNALRFMTIVPVPSTDAAIEPDWLSRCAKYFPIVGIGIGLVSAVVLLLADRIWGPVVASLLAVAASIAVTLALAFSLSLRVAALADLPVWTAAAALIAAHATARVTPIFVMNALPYAGDAAAMKVSYADASVSAHDRAFALVVVLCALLPLAFVSIQPVIAGLLLGAALAAAVTYWARQRINGYTGDVLGAIEQMFEIGFLLGVIAII